MMIKGISRDYLRQLQIIRFGFVIICCLSFCGCQSNQSSSSLPYIGLKGETMGTFYSIKYGDVKKRNFQVSLDSLLLDINMAVSTYIPESTISQFNKSTEAVFIVDPENKTQHHFIENFEASRTVYAKSKGLYDPSCMPLVNYWGFGYEGKEAVSQVDSQKVQSILTNVGLSKIESTMEQGKYLMRKAKPEVSLDFSAIAKGYGVDRVAGYLEDQGVENYMVEIGGEVKTLGLNDKGLFWKIGINKPKEQGSLRDFECIVQPKAKALASSGNYRIFHETEDLKYGHEINPITGFPEQTDLLSASVIHPSCMYADAYATAFMIMGLKKSLLLSNNIPELEACFIIEKNGKLYLVPSDGFEEYVVEEGN